MILQVHYRIVTSVLHPAAQMKKTLNLQFSFISKQTQLFADCLFYLSSILFHLVRLTGLPITLLVYYRLPYIIGDLSVPNQVHGTRVRMPVWV